MDDTEMDKLATAVPIVVNMEAQLKNLSGRVDRAIKVWSKAASDSTDAANKQKLKVAVIEMTRLAKDAKVVLKDLNSLAKDSGNAKILASCPTAKAFRDTVANKRLASSKAWDDKAMQFSTAMLRILGGRMYPGMGDVDVKVTMQSIKNFNHYYNEMRVAFAKV